ncbi:arginine--tRNA ligase [Candidatus Woesearchaeota archaeon]|nr:arginine--tRNA ligase [Candidatus Woesearchaeota archaeon]
MKFKKEFAKLISKETKIEESKLIKIIEVPPDLKLGDYAFPCFILSKELKKSPQEISKLLSNKLKSSLFLKFEPIGPYINAFVNKQEFIKEVFKDKIIEKKSERVLVEYMSANPNKPLHIGQARNICIGNSMIKIYKYLGYSTLSVNYGDDTGVNVGYNIVAHMYYQIPIKTDKKFDHYCGQIYTEMRKKEDDPKFKEILSETLLKIEEGKDKDVMKFHQQYTKKCAISQFESCWRLNAFFNLANWESDILHLKFFESTIERLKQDKHVRYLEEGDLKGCWVLDLSEIDEFKGNKNTYQVLIKSDGVATYVAKDIVYAMWKLGYLKKDFFYKRLVKQSNEDYIYTTSSNPADTELSKFRNNDIAIAVIDNRQDHPQKVVKAALKILNFETENKHYYHLSYGVVYLTPKTLIEFGFKLTPEEKKESRLPFSSRKGWFVTLDETMNKLHEKAYQESKKRNLEKSEEWLHSTAEAIALASLRFFLTKYDTNKDITFDIDEVLDMEGETGAYVLYSYARISNIFSKAELAPEKLQKTFKQELLQEDLELEIIKKISQLDEIIESAKNKLAPNILCNYILELCQLFNSYYANFPILNNEKDLKIARLNLLKKLQEILKTSINLIGIKEVDRM